MTAAPTAPSRPPGRPRLLVPVLTVIVLLFVFLGAIVSFYVNWLWFGEVGYRQVLTTSIVTRIVLFAVGLAATGLVLAATMVTAYRARPQMRPMSLEQQSLERYRVAIEPRRKLLVSGVSVAVGLFVGAAAASSWEAFQLWRNGKEFGTDDPQFGRDVGYYVFTLPFQQFVVGMLIALVVLAIMMSVATHYLYGGIRLQGGGDRVTRAAGVQLSVLFGCLFLLKAGAYYLDRFAMLTGGRSIVTGASYTDVNAELPARTILVWIALLAAVVCFANVALRITALPLLTLGMVLGVSVVVAGVYPAIVEQFRVKPNANELEAPYIARNIEATNRAYGLDGVQYTPFEGRTSAAAADLSADATTIYNSRLMDPNVLSPTFNQLQQIRNVYGFPDLLDIDRYPVDGQLVEQVVAVRELDSAALVGQQLNWINRHLVYTHGNGFVAAPTNVVDQQGAPTFTTGNLPTTGQIELEQSRIYYGELLTDYSITGQTEGEPPREFDRPTTEDANSGQVTYTYTGEGGIKLSNPIRRLAFAVNYREGNILLSSAVTPESKLLMIRDPRERVAKVAPFLELDKDAYPSVINGRIVWIVDGYTSTGHYPYSQQVDFNAASLDSIVAPQAQQLQSRTVNYVRNSVKATVDAYNGTVNLYAFDESDPILEAWEGVFPGLVKPAAEITDDLRAHFRYPEDVFKIQREIITRYHVTDPVQFFGGQGFWRVPPDPTTESGTPQPPYYILAQVLGQEVPTFQLTAALTQQRRDNLAAWMSASSDPADYGTIRVFELPGNTAIRGPRQVQIAFNTNPDISRDVTLLDAQNSKVVFGNLLTLPVAGGLLYVEPFYVEGTGETSYPLLRKVMLEFGGDVAYEDTLSQGLDSLFGPGAGDVVASLALGSPVTPPPPPDSGDGGSATDLEQAAQDIATAISALQAAQRAGDFEAYGQALAELDAATRRYLELSGEPEPSSSDASASPPPDSSDA